ncbi:MAG: VWA containing CoxE family protein, partial [[Clostridium] symbiosum]
IDWIKTLKKRFTSAVWLNPLHEKLWDYDASTRTIQIIREQFPMFPLTVQGLEAAIKELRKGEA